MTNFAHKNIFKLLKNKKNLIKINNNFNSKNKKNS